MLEEKVTHLTTFPMSYSVLSLGHNPRAPFWDPVVQVQNKFSSLRKAFFSKRGRLTSIQSVSNKSPFIVFVSSIKAQSENIMGDFLRNELRSVLGLI